ncbi:MAG TPA: FAD:protein FMN transferase, partial [Syntrophomonas sp.]|nr:FAD:protein FMN transferase [Syntrophomonas sp.]
MTRQSKKNLAIAAIILLTVGISIAGCSSNRNKPHAANSFAMGTVISQKVYGDQGEEAIAAVEEKIKSMEEMLTFNAPEGDVYQLNKNAGQQQVQLHSETIAIMKKAQEIAVLSNGAFDITIGPLVKTWGIGTKDEHIPAADVLQQLLSLVNYQDLDIGSTAAGLKRAGQMVDLGGIAKGYAGDVAIQIYKQFGIKSAFINIGGNVAALGSKPDGSPWTVGIRNPRPDSGQTQEEQILGYIAVQNQAVTTAGDDQRYFIKDGQRYFHILDPKTGYPAQSGLMSVTLVTDSSFDADALDTAVFILGLERGRELLRQYGGVEAVFITTDKKIYITDGLKDRFKLQDASHQSVSY